MAKEKINIQIGDETIELKGAELDAFLQQRAKDQAELSLLEAETTKREADRASAMAKLSKLGLTDDEIASLIP